MMSDKNDGVDRIDGVLAAGGFGGGGGDAEADDDEHGDARGSGRWFGGIPTYQASRLRRMGRRGLGYSPSVASRSGVGASLEVSLRPATTCCAGSFTMLAVAGGGADVREGVFEAAV